MPKSTITIQVDAHDANAISRALEYYRESLLRTREDSLKFPGTRADVTDKLQIVADLQLQFAQQFELCAREKDPFTSASEALNKFVEEWNKLPESVRQAVAK